MQDDANGGYDHGHDERKNGNDDGYDEAGYAHDDDVWKSDDDVQDVLRNLKKMPEYLFRLLRVGHNQIHDCRNCPGIVVDMGTICLK